jgi:hypothetical protein
MHVQEGQAIYERAVNALPTNLFLHLAYADLLESGKRVAEAKGIYERIIQHTPGTNTLAHIHYLRFLRRTEVWLSLLCVVGCHVLLTEAVLDNRLLRDRMLRVSSS